MKRFEVRYKECDLHGEDTAEACWAWINDQRDRLGKPLKWTRWAKVYDYKFRMFVPRPDRTGKG